MSLFHYKPRQFYSLLLAAFVVLLSACSGEEQTELKGWMKQQRDKTPTSIPPVAAPLAFVPTPYVQTASTDPFDEQKLKSVLAKIALSAKDAGVPAPDVSRKREPLEAFPLESIKMTGFVLKQGKPTALVYAGGTLFNVSVGQYIGQDFGKITAISEQEVNVKELIQDSGGAWADRVNRLPLFVVAKETKK